MHEVNPYVQYFRHGTNESAGRTDVRMIIRADGVQIPDVIMLLLPQR